MTKGWSSGKLSWFDWNIRKLASFSPRLTVGEICLLLPWETYMVSPRVLLLAPLIAIPWKKTMCPFPWRPLLFVCLSGSFRFTLSPSLNKVVFMGAGIKIPQVAIFSWFMSSIQEKYTHPSVPPTPKFQVASLKTLSVVLKWGEKYPSPIFLDWVYETLRRAAILCKKKSQKPLLNHLSWNCFILFVRVYIFWCI